MTYRLLSAGSAMLVTALVTALAAVAGVLVGAGRAHADDPVMHHVKYTVTAKNPIYADIYYIDKEPPTFADYSHNPYQFAPHVNFDVGPDKAWSFELDLTKPEVWAMVTASTGTEPGTPGLHCELSVDGVVVVSKDGPKGVLCSIRHW